MRKNRLGREASARTCPRPKRAGTTLGLEAFEKISAVEGIRLDDRMRADLDHMDRSGMDEPQRSRFVLERYGRP